MNKLLIMTHNMACGGCEHVIVLLAGEFVKRGLSVDIAIEHRAQSYYPLPSGVRLIPLTDRDECGARHIPLVYRSLRRLVKSERPDAVLAMPEKVNVWTVLFLLGSGVPVIVSERSDPRRHPENRIKRALRRLVYPFAAGFVFQTEGARDFFPRRVRDRGAVLDNPLDLARMPAPWCGAREKTVAAAGRLDPAKNFALLLESFALFHKTHPDYTLTVYGEGSLRGALEAKALRLLPPEAARFPGQTDALAEKLSRSGMFVLSSDFEGMPNALIEALALGLPCVSTDCGCGGQRTLICDGENGLLVPVGQAEPLARAMARLADEPPLARKLSQNGPLLRARFDAARVAAAWLSYIESRVKRRGPSK